jgi:hypothetical protein
MAQYQRQRGGSGALEPIVASAKPTLGACGARFLPAQTLRAPVGALHALRCAVRAGEGRLEQSLSLLRRAVGRVDTPRTAIRGTVGGFAEPVTRSTEPIPAPTGPITSFTDPIATSRDPIACFAGPQRRRAGPITTPGLTEEPFGAAPRGFLARSRTRVAAKRASSPRNAPVSAHECAGVWRGGANEGAGGPR